MDTKQVMIRLLGTVAVQRGDATTTRFRTRKTALLLARLAHPGSRPATREALAEAIWPDELPECGSASLRTALSALRRMLEPSPEDEGQVIAADRLTVHLVPGSFTTDAAEFEAALAARDASGLLAAPPDALASALALYSGPYLVDFDNDWAALERARLGDLYHGAVRRLVHALAQARDLDAATEWAHRLVEIDPLREESHVLLMRLYASTGRGAAVLERYRRLEHILARDLDRAPGRAAREIAAQVRPAPGAGAAGRPSAPTPHYARFGMGTIGERRPWDWTAPLVQAAQARALPPDLLRLLGRLSVFADGWTAEAADDVCAENGDERGAVAAGVEALCARSLVVVEATEDGPRYRLQEPVAAGAADLVEDESRTALRARHAAHFLALAAGASRAQRAPDRPVWHARIDREAANIRAALAHAAAATPEMGLRLMAALDWHWVASGALQEGRTWLTRLLERCSDQGPTPLRAAALEQLARFTALHGDPLGAETISARAVRVAQAAGARAEEAAALVALGDAAYRLGDLDTCSAKLEAALAIWREQGGRADEAAVLTRLGHAALCRGDLDAAGVLYEQGLNIRRDESDGPGESDSLADVAYAASASGDAERAQELYTEGLAVARGAGDLQGEAARLWSMGNLALEQADPVRARDSLEAALEIFRRLRNRPDWSTVLHSLALAATDQGDSDAARAYLDERLPLLREQRDRRSLADWLEASARVAFEAGRAEEAAVRLGAAESVREETGYGLWLPDTRARFDRTVSAIRAALPDEMFEAAWRSGRSPLHPLHTLVPTDG